MGKEAKLKAQRRQQRKEERDLLVKRTAFERDLLDFGKVVPIGFKPSEEGGTGKRSPLHRG